MIAVFSKLFKTFAKLFPKKKALFFLLIKNLLEQKHTKLFSSEILSNVSLFMLHREVCRLIV